MTPKFHHILTEYFVNEYISKLTQNYLYVKF